MKILFAAGGTAGHINPALSIAHYLKEKTDSSILFIGTEKGLEKKLIPDNGFDIRFIKVRGFKRKLTLDNAIIIEELVQSFGQVREIIKDFKPDAVIGTGGYVSGPVVFCAHLMKIPTLIHESNSFPGLTVKILSKFCDITAVGFEDSRHFLKMSRKIIHTGNPIRPELLRTDYNSARKKLKLSDKPVILVMGGSLGAQKINDVMIQYIRKIYYSNRIQLLFATGDREYQRVMEKLGELIDFKDSNIRIMPYINDINMIAACDMAVCRSGAITVSEMTALGKPSILIPSPNVVHNHQEYNARTLEKSNAAVVLTEDRLDHITLSREIDNLLKDKKKLDVMSKSAYSIGVRDAVEKIHNCIELLIKRQSS